MAYTVKPLGKNYTMIDIVNTISLWLRKEIQKELDPEFVKTLVNLAVMDVAEILSGAGSGDYSKDVTIADESSSVTNTVKTSATYVNLTRKVTKATHGLTANDIGKRIALWEATGLVAAISEIESITDSSNFIIKNSLGSDWTLSYAVFSAYSEPVVDLSTYNIAQITKVFDSINKEVIETGDKEFDNLYRFPTKQNKCYFNFRGQNLFLYKGTEVPNFGTITMTYNSSPQKTTEDDDKLDIKDMYIPLVILKAKNFSMEHLGLTAPDVLTNLIDQKTREVRENIMKEKEISNIKNQKA